MSPRCGRRAPGLSLPAARTRLKPVRPSAVRVCSPVTSLRRLRSTRDIHAVFAARRVAHSSSLSVHMRQRDDEHGGRVTVAAGKAVGGAVARNRAKRRIRAALQAESVPLGTDAVVVAKRAAVARPYSALQRDLRSALRRVGPTGDAP